MQQKNCDKVHQTFQKYFSSVFKSKNNLEKDSYTETRLAMDWTDVEIVEF